jgi:hypothetical protein
LNASLLHGSEDADVDVRISIEQPEPPIGTAASGDRGPLPFEGWLGLLGALSALVDTSRSKDSGGSA